MQEEVEQADITDSVVVGVWRYVITDDYDFAETVVDFQESAIGKDKCSEIGNKHAVKMATTVISIRIILSACDIIQNLSNFASE